MECKAHRFQISSAFDEFLFIQIDIWVNSNDKIIDRFSVHGSHNFGHQITVYGTCTNKTLLSLNRIHNIFITSNILFYDHLNNNDNIYKRNEIEIYVGLYVYKPLQIN